MARIGSLLVSALTLTTVSAQLAPHAKAPLDRHMVEVNAQWKDMDPAPLHGEQNITFRNEAERIATHLHMVRERLLDRIPKDLSVAQVTRRTQLLDRLGDYADAGSFPQNHVLPVRNPVFIDPYGRACAVGWLMIESGHNDLAVRISSEMNLAYVLDMPGTAQWPAIAAWAEEHGFEANELAWIQPGYPPSVPWASLGGGTDGPVKVLHALDNGSVLVAGNFSEAGGTAANQVAVWDGSSYTALGAGMQGDVNCAVEFDGAIYIGGSLLNGNADLAKWDGSSWSFSVVFDGKLPLIHALHVHQGVLHAAGETMGFAGVDHQVKRLVDNTWEVLGLPFNEAVLALETFNDELVAGGAFTLAIGATDPEILRVARFDGTDWTQLGGGLDATVRDLLTVNGTLHAGGDLFINILPTFGLAKLLPASADWEHLLPGHVDYMSDAIGPSYINALAAHSGMIYMVGRFTVTLLFVYGNNVASFNGTPDGVSPMAALDQEVRAVALTNNRLYIGGDFNITMPHVATVDLATSVIEVDDRQLLSMSPVPASDHLFIDMPGKDTGEAGLEVRDAQGRAVPVRVSRLGDRIQVDVQELPSGMYVVHLHTRGGSMTGRFIKA